ncbi:MAG TPA: hypothetical protein P5572_21985 [Phycisphaerae bacterium]|nr:hypothetical protein [Phycisphaerales bacterium]HRX87706.1 hypothetical protein [Phycisphaerae bacterium]
MYKTHFVPFMVIALIAYVPYALYMMLVGMGSGAAEAVSPDNPFAAPTVSAGQEIANVLGRLVFLVVVLPLVQAALTFAISGAVLGEPVEAGSAFGRAKKCILPLLGTQFLVGIVVVIGFMLLIVPGVIFSLWFMVVAPVVILERLSGSTAMGRSRELMRDNLGKGFLLALVLAIIGWAITFGAAAIFAYLPLPAFIYQAILLIVEAIILPVQTAPLILLYYDLRVRKEAFDLERLAESVQGGPEVSMA